MYIFKWNLGKIDNVFYYNNNNNNNNNNNTISVLKDIAEVGKTFYEQFNKTEL
jgi:hypothetical protein